MFDNPFRSFHDVVADAKEEREQLNRLLTISTPRERLLVITIAVFLVILSTWLLFGNIARSITLNGILVEQAETLPEGSRLMQAFVWVQGGSALSIEAGMPVKVELDMEDAKASTLGGAVKAISAIHFSEQMPMSAPVAPVSLHRVDIELDEGLDRTSLVSRDCRLVVGLGRQSPLELFLAKRL